MPGLASPREPTVDERNAIVERCKAAIDEGRDPLAILTAEEHQALINLHIVNPAGGLIVLSQLRDHAEHNPDEARRWSPRRAQRITFQPYVQAARIWHDARQQAQRTSNVMSLAEARNARQPRPRGPLASLNPAQMITMASPRMRGIGLLRSVRQGRVWYDDFYKRVLFDWNGTSDDTVIQAHTLNDEFIRNVALWMAQTDEKLGNITDRQVKIWIETMADMDKRHAPRDWLNGLVWDGVERIHNILGTGFGAHETPFNRAISRCWFVGMVARIMRPGCQLDTMPVLIGPQGIGKSQALRIIGGEWYRSAISDIHSKDFKQELFGAIVFEIPELHSLVTSNAAAAKVKAVISNQIDHFRLPYGYTVEEFRRTAVMVGTTNNRDWHHDESGARRFWPIHCDGVDLLWLKEWRDQLFAEARAYFDLGIDEPRGRWWLNEADEQEQRELMAYETAEDSWENIIATQIGRTDAARPQIYGRDSQTMTQHDGTLSETTDWGNLLTTTRIAYSWLWLNSEQAGRRTTSNRIGTIMRNLGWSRTQQRLPGSSMRLWIWTRPESTSVTDDYRPPDPTPDDDDIAF